MKTSYNKLAKIYTNCFGHITEMADMPIYSKNPLKIFFSRTSRLIDILIRYVHFGYVAYQVCSNDDPRLTLTYLTSRSNCFPLHLSWIFFEKLIFNTVEAIVIVLKLRGNSYK